MSVSRLADVLAVLNRDGVRGRSRELRAGREKLRVNATDVRAQIAQAMSRAVAQIELAKRRVVLSQRAIDLANENIRIETDRFNLGKSTNFDVLNRHEELRQAELRKAQALIDWHKARDRRPWRSPATCCRCSASPSTDTAQRIAMNPMCTPPSLPSRR